MERYFQRPAFNVLCSFLRKAFRIIPLSMVCILSTACTNPFDTRDPEKPGSGGAAIKPPTTPENVLYNLETAFETLSGEEYTQVFGTSFVFSPDPDDSLLYEQEFAVGWGIDTETMFAGNFLQSANFRPGASFPIDMILTYEYKPGFGFYEVQYQMFLLLAEASPAGFSTVEVEGYAWLTLMQDSEGRWSVERWIDHRKAGTAITWGALRAQYI